MLRRRSGEDMDEIDTVVLQLGMADPADRVSVLERIDELNRYLGQALDQGGDAYRNWMRSTWTLTDLVI